jgi:phosphonate transport system substrate-binding protein
MKKFGFIVLLGGFLLFCPPQTFSKPIVPFGPCSRYNPRIMYQLYQPFVDYLSRNTPYQFEIKLSRVYEETVDNLGRGEIPTAFSGPVPYVKAREKYKVRPILRAWDEEFKYGSTEASDSD